MASIIYERRVAGSLVDADSVVLEDSTATFGIKNNTSGATIVASGTAVTHTDDGTYEYNIDALAVGNYTAVWKVTEGAVVTYVTHVFNVDEEATVADGTKLEDIERELAYRVGPFFWEKASSGSTSTVVIPAFRSSLNYLQGVEDLYILRRGKKEDGSSIAAFDDDDRIRLVDSVDAGTGTVTPDRTWTNAPVADEMLEFHHLHPERELRKAVKEGLKRTYFLDRASITFGSAASERDMTDLAPWITNRRQVKQVQMSYSGGVHLPYDLGWWSSFEKAGDAVWLQAARDPYPNTMLIYALRPGDTYVNGTTSLSGPDDDDDTLHVDVNYAAAAGHVEAWRRFRSRLQPAAQTGLQMTQMEAAREFTKVSKKHNPRLPERWHLSSPVGYVGPQLP